MARYGGPMPGAILFDCDGVLVNSEELVIEIERRLLADLGLEYDHAEYLTRFVGTSDSDFVARLREDHASRGRGTFPDDFIQQVHDLGQEVFTHRLKATQGVADYLARLALPRAVASSSHPENLRRKLRLTNLEQWFGEHVYSAALVARGKPAPDLFLLAAERLGVPPTACIVIEDSVLGVRAGVAAGMKVWGFTGGGHADAALGARLLEAGAEYTFTHFDELGAPA